MAFKSSTVNSSKVAATLSNFPSFFDPSRIGITTLAQAQSSRFYADSGKVTEYAREVVSATEIHAKITSLTTSSVVYCDYDGIRADYAVTDTYGRNAVWSGYKAVHHGDGVVDSSGNLGNLTNTGSVAYSTGKIGKAFDGGTANSTKRMSITGSTPVTGAEIDSAATMSTWIYAYATKNGSIEWINQLVGSGTTRTMRIRLDNAGSPFTLLAQYSGVFPIHTNGITAGQWYHVVLTKSGSTVYLYKNASANTISYANSTGGTVGYYPFSHEGTDPTSFFSGMTDEVRTTNVNLSADWITTEYNNQNDESTFWGAWADVGGASQNSNFLMFM